MKLFELTIKEDGIKIRRESEERLTGEQRFYIAIFSIIATVILGIAALVALA